MRISSAPRPVSTVRPAPRGGGDLRPTLWFAHCVLVSLALMSGSWRSAPVEPPVAEAYAPAHALGALSDSLIVQDVTQTPVAARPVRMVRMPHLSEALRAIAPTAGETLPIDSETLWLARCIYSESDRPHEQELVAWVVRNRVATAYRGERTYRGVVLDPKQFSAFNVGAKRRSYYMSLTPESQAPGWRRALLIASYVRRAPWSLRPFDVRVRHFYSEISMVGRRHPTWAIGERPVIPNRPYAIDPYRFRFLALRSEA